ncbi:MAG: hypothetical protein K6F92_07950 [Lachnospiraceae bacterium]|nr:hypothetical protein [Lachnospiraceae bacterium]
MERIQVRIIVALLAVLGVFSLSACAKSPTFYAPYTSSDTADLDANVNKVATLEAYSNDIVVLLDNSSYPVENVSASQALAFKLSNKEVVLCKNGYEEFQPGNITKLFASYYVLMTQDIYQYVTVGSDIYNIDSSLFAVHFTKNDCLRFKDLIYGAVLYGANDVIIPMADNTSGSLNSFAGDVTSYVTNMGAENTTLLNCYGTASAGMKTTIYDVYMILRDVLINDDILKLLESKSYSCEYTNNSNPASVKWYNALPYFTGELETKSGLVVLGGMCENASLEPTQMLVLAQDETGETYAVFVTGCASFSDCKASVEEILYQIANL